MTQKQCYLVLFSKDLGICRKTDWKWVLFSKEPGLSPVRDRKWVLFSKESGLNSVRDRKLLLFSKQPGLNPVRDRKWVLFGKESGLNPVRDRKWVLFGKEPGSANGKHILIVRQYGLSAVWIPALLRDFLLWTNYQFAAAAGVCNLYYGCYGTTLSSLMCVVIRWQVQYPSS